MVNDESASNLTVTCSEDLWRHDIVYSNGWLAIADIELNDNYKGFWICLLFEVFVVLAFGLWMLPWHKPAGSGPRSNGAVIVKRRLRRTTAPTSQPSAVATRTGLMSVEGGAGVSAAAAAATESSAGGEGDVHGASVDGLNREATVPASTAPASSPVAAPASAAAASSPAADNERSRGSNLPEGLAEDNRSPPQTPLLQRRASSEEFYSEKMGRTAQGEHWITMRRDYVNAGETDPHVEHFLRSPRRTLPLQSPTGGHHSESSSPSEAGLGQADDAMGTDTASSTPFCSGTPPADAATMAPHQVGGINSPTAFVQQANCTPAEVHVTLDPQATGTGMQRTEVVTGLNVIPKASSS